MNIENISIECLEELAARAHTKTIPGIWGERISNDLQHRCWKLLNKLVSAIKEKRISEGKYCNGL
jgi:hypothetical protein